MASIETMFSTRTVPWFRQGKVVEGAVSSAEALKASGLDWNVLQRPIYTTNLKNPNVADMIDGMKANIRDKDGRVLGVVSDLYKVVQNKDAFAFCDALLGEGATYEVAGSFDDGKRIWLLAKLPEDEVLGDKINPYLMFLNAFNGKGSIKCAITPIRVACNNAIRYALGKASSMWTCKHVGEMNAKLEEAKRTLGFAKDYMTELKADAEILAGMTITTPQFSEIVEQLLPFPPETEKASDRKIKNVQEAREDLTARFKFAPDLEKFRNTKWGVISAVSDFVTHEYNSFADIVDSKTLIDQARELVARV